MGVRVYSCRHMTDSQDLVDRAVFVLYYIFYRERADLPRPGGMQTILPDVP